MSKLTLQIIILLVLLLGTPIALLASETYCNGQTKQDTWGTYYPNGQKVEDAWGTYYPTGEKINDAWGAYYPNGQKVEDAWGAYYPNNQKIKDAWGIYYDNGQKVMDAWGCYTRSGSKIDHCPDTIKGRYRFKEESLSRLKMFYWINTDTGEHEQNFEFQEMVRADQELSYVVNLELGQVIDIDLYCY